MIKLALKTFIYDMCIDTFYDTVIKNFTSTKRPTKGGEIYKYAGEYYYVDEETGNESYCDETITGNYCWRYTDTNQVNPTLGVSLYLTCLQLDLYDEYDDIIGESNMSLELGFS